jgi:ribosomal protein L32
MPKHPVPKQKTSKGRSSSRYKSYQNKARIRLTEAVKLVKCEKCGEDRKAHNACVECGFYRGKSVKNDTVKTAKTEEKVKTIKAD